MSRAVVIAECMAAGIGRHDVALRGFALATSIDWFRRTLVRLSNCLVVELSRCPIIQLSNCPMHGRDIDWHAPWFAASNNTTIHPSSALRGAVAPGLGNLVAAGGYGRSVSGDMQGNLLVEQRKMSGKNAVRAALCRQQEWRRDGYSSPVCKSRLLPSTCACLEDQTASRRLVAFSTLTDAVGGLYLYAESLACASATVLVTPSCHFHSTLRQIFHAHAHSHTLAYTHSSTHLTPPAPHDMLPLLPAHST